MLYVGTLVALALLILVVRPFGATAEVRPKRELRPVRKLATDDPLAPFLGGNIVFPPEPDEDGHDLEHHLVIDPAELRGSSGTPAAPPDPPR